MKIKKDQSICNTTGSANCHHGYVYHQKISPSPIFWEAGLLHEKDNFVNVIICFLWADTALIKCLSNWFNL